jgi:hypothetical protein
MGHWQCLWRRVLNLHASKCRLKIVIMAGEYST